MMESEIRRRLEIDLNTAAQVSGIGTFMPIAPGA
jgi:hypothetical protein